MMGRLARGSAHRAERRRHGNSQTTRARPAAASCLQLPPLAPQELSFGTIAPSLYQFAAGAERSDPEIRLRQDLQLRSVFGLLNMPRLGHNGVADAKSRSRTSWRSCWTPTPQSNK